MWYSTRKHNGISYLWEEEPSINWICLTHWGQVTHICIGNLRHHWFRKWLVTCLATSHYLNQCWVIINLTLKKKLQWNFNQNTKLFVHENQGSHTFRMTKFKTFSRLFQDHFCDFQDRFLSYVINNMLPRKGYKTQSKTKLISILTDSGWETSARPLANASENLVGRVENRTGRVEFCIGYIRDYPVRASAKIF